MSYTLVPTELIVDGAITSAKLDTNISISGTLGVTGELTLATHLNMGDNDKIKIGAGGDLEIYHDGSNSYIANSTGNIYIADTNGAVHIQAKLNEESIVATADGAVTLYHDNSAKLATASGGVTVTGTINDLTLAAGSIATSTSQNFALNTPNSLRINIDSNNSATDQIFVIGHNQTAVDNNNSLLTILESGNVGIGTTNPAQKLDVSGHAQIGDGGSAVLLNFNATGNAQLKLNDTERMRIDSSGNVGIGTTSPADRLHVALDSSTTNAEVEVMRIEASSSGTPAVGFGPFIDFRGDRINGGVDSYGRLGFEADAMPSTKVDGAFVIQPAEDGTYTERFRVSSDGKVGIGETSPSQNLDVKGSTVNTGVLFYNTNTTSGASVPLFLASESGGSTTNVSIENAGASNMLFRTGATSKDGFGTERVRITSAGNVGIGENTPTHHLHVNSGTTNVVAVFESTDTEATIRIKDNTGTAAIKCRNDFRFNTSESTELMRLNSSGRVGIGNTSPNANLHVGTSNAIGDATNPAIQIGGSNSYRLGIYTTAEGAVIDNNNGDDGISFFTKTNGEMMRLQADGVAHITSAGAPIAPTIKHGGATGDVAKLRLINRSGQGADKGGVLEIGAVTDDGVSRSDVFASIAGLKDNATSGNKAGYMQFMTSNGSSLAEKMRLNSNGTLMIGTSTNPTYAHRLFANGNSITNGIVRFSDDDVSVGLANVVLQLNFSADNDCTSGSFLYMTDSGGAIGSITAASGTSVSFNTTSDERLKKNIVDASSQLDTIKNIKVREFDWKKNDYHELGVIAQEIKTVVPNVVTEGGDDETERPFGVDYGKIVPYLIKAVQEQQTIIDDLKSRIETLEG